MMPQFASEIDHLVVTASSLEAGVAFVEAELGCRMQPGGQHPQMGTHNRLLRLGTNVYLEVLAIDPTAAAPERARWFGLDQLTAADAPRLSAWVMRTQSIHELAARCPEPLGAVELMRRGELEWWITIPPDGRCVMGGAMPPLIEWRTKSPPATRLPESGIELLELELRHHETAQLQKWFEIAGFQGSIRLGKPLSGEEGGLGAVLRRSDGHVVRWSSAS